MARGLVICVLLAICAGQEPFASDPSTVAVGEDEAPSEPTEAGTEAAAPSQSAWEPDGIAEGAEAPAGLREDAEGGPAQSAGELPELSATGDVTQASPQDLEETPEQATAPSPVGEEVLVQQPLSAAEETAAAASTASAAESTEGQEPLPTSPPIGKSTPPRPTRAPPAARVPTPREATRAAIHSRRRSTGSGRGLAKPVREWFHGFFSSMLDRKLLTLNSSLFVLCFGLEEAGGCAVAAGEGAAIAATGDSASPWDGPISQHPQLLPSLPWQEAQPFGKDSNSSVQKVEVERLSASTFVVCFQRDSWQAGAISCTVGALDDGSSARLLPFPPPVPLSVGRLVSITVMGAGTRVAVCFHTEVQQQTPQEGGQGGSEHTGQRPLGSERGPISCLWMQVAEWGAGPALVLAEEERIQVSV